VEAVSASDSSLRALSRRAYIGVRQRPVLLLLGGAAVLALGAGLVAARVTVFALDETLIQQSAVHYTTNLPHSLFHDLDARATNRLYSLLLSIAFRLFSGASAIRVDHVLSVLLFVSTAAPVFLMARVMLRSERYAVAVALLSVAVPWLTLTSALFTENLSYPLFWWMLLATCRAVWQPSLGSDLLALLSIALLVGTRVQFAAVFVGYLLALLVTSIWRADRSKGFPRRLARGVVTAARGYPFTFIIFAAAAAVFVYEKASGEWQAHVEQLFGTYSNVLLPHHLPSNMAEGLLVELIALALGVGLLPAIVSIVWFARRMSHPRLDRRSVYLTASAVVILAFLVLTVYSQGGYLGANTEERYFFYVVPVFWLGAFAAFEDRDVRAGEVLACAVALAALYAGIPFLSQLSQERAFLAPVESVVPHVLSQRLVELRLTGLTIQDALAILAVLAGIATAVLWRWRPGARMLWTVGAAATVQLLLVGYAYAVIDGKVQGIPGRTAGSVSALGWVDAHARSSGVTWLDNLSIAAPAASAASAAEDQTRTTLFWNSRLKGWTELPELGLPPVEWPMSALPGVAGLAVNRSSGLLEPEAGAAGLNEIVGATDSAFLQLEGSSLASSPDGILTLTELSRPARASWLATGLQPDGAILAGARVQLLAFADRSASPVARAITFTLSPPAPAVLGEPARTETFIRLGSASRRVALSSGAGPRPITLAACFDSGHAVVRGALRATRSVSVAGRQVAGSLTAVAVAPLGSEACHPAAR
jgi:hypothetical protein